MVFLKEVYLRMKKNDQSKLFKKFFKKWKNMYSIKTLCTLVSKHTIAMNSAYSNCRSHV